MYHSSSDPWHWNIGFSPQIDFCFWILEVAGIHVPPFTTQLQYQRNLDYDELTTADWQTWFNEVVNRQVQLHQRGLTMTEHTLPTTDELRQVLEPPRAWHGAPTLQQVFDTQWRQYQQQIDQRRRQIEALNQLFQKSPLTRLWDELVPYHSHIPWLHIVLIAYTKPIVYPVAPVSILLSVNKKHPRAVTLDQAIRTGVAALVPNLEKGKPS